MLLREVEYARPASVPEALRLLGSHEGARALAGGQTLINVWPPARARAATCGPSRRRAFLDARRTSVFDLPQEHALFSSETPAQVKNQPLLTGSS